MHNKSSSHCQFLVDILKYDFTDFKNKTSWKLDQFSSLDQTDTFDKCSMLGYFQNSNPADNFSTHTPNYLTNRHQLVKYVYPILLAFGVLGNFLSFLAMLTKYKKEVRLSRNLNIKPSTFSVCLALLCFADFVILIVGCLSEYLDVMMAVSVRSASILSCKLVSFSCYLFSSYAAYLYSFIAVDRWRAVTSPLAHHRTQHKRVNLWLAGIFLYCALICSPFFYFPTLYDEKRRCKFPAHLNARLKLLDAVFYSCAPYLLAMLFSCLTLVALVRNRHALKQSYVSHFNIHYLGSWKSFTFGLSCFCWPINFKF